MIIEKGLMVVFHNKTYRVEKIIPDIKCQYALIKRDSDKLLVPTIQLKKTK